MQKILRPIFSLAIGFLAVGCADNQHKLAAVGSGDLSNPAAPRSVPDAILTELCGNGSSLSESGTLVRAPYLQRVGATSARVLLTVSEETAVRVDVTLPDGSWVQSVDAVPDTTAHPTNAIQLEASLSGLAPASVYCYEVPGITAKAGFRTAPDAGGGKKLSFVAFGDSGTGDSYQHSVAQQIQTVPYDMVIHVGDVAYDKGKRGELESKFFGQYPAMTRSFAVFPVYGNHDHATESAAPFLEAFSLPDNARPEDRERYYSFNWGDVHFVGLDTERIGAPQAAWLTADLEANTLPWVVVYGHKPPYSSGEHGSNHEFRDVFGPILEQYRVPLVLNGHEHDYERTKPINGVTYVVTGGGGRGTRPVGESSFTAYSEDVLHFVFVEIEGDTLLLHAIDGVGREFDSTLIQRG